MSIERADGRSANELRPITIERNISRYAEGSAFIKWGNTHVLCTATVEEKVPPFMRGSGDGWVTAEYSMLPRSTHQRMQRDSSKGKINGRASEIQRLIGRSLRASVDMGLLGERSILIDCDVIQADGGTRTASITGGYVALLDALRFIVIYEKLSVIPVKTQIAAVSAGKVSGSVLLDLCYEEDSAAEADTNLVMTSMGSFAEFQGTGEGGTFSRTELDEIINMGWNGIKELHRIQSQVLALTDEEKGLMTI